MAMKSIIKPIIAALLLLMPLLSHAISWPQEAKLEARAWVLLDAKSGQVLSNVAGETRLPPASLTKMMTLYLLFEDLELGRLSPDEQVKVSEKAWKIGGSSMFLDPRMSPTVQDLMHGISTLSGNDACIAIAEHMAGTEEAFAARMNEKARELGMQNSHFVNATGFPAEDHYSSPMDMALLGAALWRDFPERYTMFAEKSYTFDNRTQWNRNSLLWSMPEVDGIKTGHTEEAGYCLVSSAEVDGTRLVASVFGTDSKKAREQQSRTLLLHGFRNFVSLRPSEREIRREVEIFEGVTNKVWLRPAAPVWVTVPKGYEESIVFRLRYQAPLKAPVEQNQKLGSIEAVIRDNKGEISDVLATVDMVAAEDVEQASWIGRQWDALRLWWRDDTGSEAAE